MFLQLISTFAVVGLVASKSLKDLSCAVDNSAKGDCGYTGVNQASCESKGCCWYAVNDNSTPWCYYGVTSVCAVENSAKTDCGFSGVNEASCESKGCCWMTVKDSTTPWCYHTAAVAEGYSLSEMTETSTGYSGTLNLIGAGTTTYGADIKKLKLDIIFETADIARIKITDATKSRWEVPESVVKRPHATKLPESMNYKLSYI